MRTDLIEYRVVPVTRYVINRFQGGYSANDAIVSGSEGRGEYDNPDVAYEVAYALAKADHERLGWPPGDERIIYPRHPREDAVPVG